VVDGDSAQMIQVKIITLGITEHFSLLLSEHKFMRGVSKQAVQKGFGKNAQRTPDANNPHPYLPTQPKTPFQSANTLSNYSRPSAESSNHKPITYSHRAP